MMRPVPRNQNLLHNVLSVKLNSNALQTSRGLPMNRRKFLALSSVAAGAALIENTVPAGAQKSSSSAPQEDLVKYVNVFVGTGGHGHCFPGATVPFGAVQLSPDTGIRD